MITNVPWYVSNQTLHDDLKIPLIKEVIHSQATKYRNRNKKYNRPLFFLSYLFAGCGRSLNSSQVRVTAITGATGNCTFEASPLLEINNTISTLHKLFIYLAKCCNLFSKHGVMWPFTIIKF
jgi:hypothetical protein